MEALAIAVAMREARHLNKSAALVTPDRALARRVIAALGRWNLEFDDSGGDALMDTSGGNFRAACRGGGGETAGAADAAGAAQASAAAGSAARTARFKRAIEVLELALLRGTRPQAGKQRPRARLRRGSATSSRNSAAARLPRCIASEPRAGFATRNSIRPSR